MSEIKRTGASMYVIATVLAIVLLTALFSEAITERLNPNRNPVSEIDNTGARSVVLKRNRAGHYVASGQINSVDAVFLLDTGATDVAVSARLAEKARLPRGRPVRVATANGVITAYATTIANLDIGGIQEFDVAASVVPDLPDGQILLGMSFLTRLDFSQRDDVLVLTQYGATANTD